MYISNFHHEIVENVPLAIFPSVVVVCFYVINDCSRLGILSRAHPTESWKSQVKTYSLGKGVSSRFFLNNTSHWSKKKQHSQVQTSKGAWTLMRTRFNFGSLISCFNVSAHLSNSNVKPGIQTILANTVNFIIALIGFNTFECPGVDRGSSSCIYIVRSRAY